MNEKKNPYRTLDTKPIKAPNGAPKNEPRVTKTTVASQKPGK